MPKAGLFLASLLLATALFSSLEVAGQASETPIFLALPETFPNVDARLVLLREPGREIVVFNPASVGVDELKVGLNLLARFRRERGAPTRGQMIPVTGFAPAPRLTDAERSQLEAALAELRTRPIANVGNLGPGRWMRLGR
jgi:hypothetical protein